MKEKLKKMAKKKSFWMIGILVIILVIIAIFAIRVHSWIGNLDSATGSQIMELFQGLHEQGNTIVLITHNESIADQAGRSIQIRDGQVREVGA